MSSYHGKDSRGLEVAVEWPFEPGAVAYLETEGGAYLNRETTAGVIEALTDLLKQHDEAEAEKAKATQLAADVATAKALEIGTRVQISETPMWDRETPLRLYADKVAGRVGTVFSLIDGDDPNEPYGVYAGRVVVQVPDVVTGQGRDIADIHVSSLTVLPPAAPEFKVGDRVKVTALNPFSHGEEGATGTLTEIGPSIAYPDRTVYRVDLADGKSATAYAVEAAPIDYAALAAEFKPGDFALVGDNPGFYAEPGSVPNWRREILAGRAVNVIGQGSPHGGRVRVSGRGSDGRIVDEVLVHVAHLTKAKAVPA